MCLGQNPGLRAQVQVVGRGAQDRNSLEPVRQHYLPVFGFSVVGMGAFGTRSHQPVNALEFRV